ncbi:substrate-binding domain-containing protein [Mesorhizobium sp. BAC0120]|uniref:substrate-binding domain-containing protein n=1 Tax=Mesorhizobium sp. BAC0120 TaxID=3090670 RepID=UPI00298D192B|nr:substrate-binding domain-containing protein [Mesorhizobium sp. BAC0120]MDW6022486.1 substrate-binding domain-containing protein [Mesorhizobium sp. BAC0120]
MAGHLDLSITTVSRALAGHEQIALETRKRVVAAAKELGYVPNTAARTLVSGRSGFVAMVLPVRGPHLVDSFLGEFVTGLGEGLVQHGADLILAAAAVGQSELSVLRHVVESGRADGVVVTRIAETDERLAYLRERKFPFVAHGRLLDADFPYNWLDTDGAHAFGEAFDMLYELGHRHFGLLTISEPMTFRHLRQDGLAAAIARRGDPSVRLTVATAPRFDRGARIQAVNRMLAAPERPTAIVGLFDELALTVMEEASRVGLSIPRDLSVIGFDNIAASAYAPPGLTTFDASIRQCAREIAEMLLAVITDRSKEPLSRLVRPTLVTRASHGPVPGK